MLSPVELERKILSVEKSLSQWLSNRREFLLVAFLISAAFTRFVYPLWTRPMPNWSRFFLAQDRLFAVLTLLAGVFVSVWMRKSWRKWFYPLLMITAWLVPCFILKVERPIVAAPILFIFLATGLLRLSVSSTAAKSARGLCIAVVFLTLVWLLGLDAETSKSYQLFRYFWTLHLEMLLLFFVAANFRRQTPAAAINLNPLQLVAPLPWPEEMVLENNDRDLRELRASGFLQLLYAQIVFVGLMFLLPQVSAPPVDGNNPLHYLIFLVFVSAVFSTVTGFLRLFGYRAPDATYFVMLAKSPWEIWQRGSTYMARFFFRNIYFAIWSRTRQVWLATSILVLAIYVNLYLFHELFLRELLRWLSPSLPIGAGTSQQIYLLPLLWMLSWLAWMAVFYGLQKVFRFLRSDYGAWLAILITHLGSSQMFWVARNLARALGTSLD